MFIFCVNGVLLLRMCHSLMCFIIKHFICSQDESVSSTQMRVQHRTGCDATRMWRREIVSTILRQIRTCNFRKVMWKEHIIFCITGSYITVHFIMLKKHSKHSFWRCYICFYKVFFHALDPQTVHFGSCTSFVHNTQVESIQFAPEMSPFVDLFLILLQKCKTINDAAHSLLLNDSECLSYTQNGGYFQIQLLFKWQIRMKKDTLYQIKSCGC